MNNPYMTVGVEDDTNWRDRAACVGRDVNYFFAKPGTEMADAALSMCETCPVRDQCLEDALAYDPADDHGIRGGLTERARRKLRKGQAA